MDPSIVFLIVFLVLFGIYMAIIIIFQLGRRRPGSTARPARVLALLSFLLVMALTFLITVETPVLPVCLIMGLIPALLFAFMTHESIETERRTMIFLRRLQRKLSSRQDKHDGEDHLGGNGA